MQLRFVLNVLGMMICCTAVAVLIPAIADAITGNSDWRHLVVSAAAMGYIGFTCMLVTRGPRPLHFTLRTAFLLTGLCWTALPLFAALPFLGLGVSFVDAVFEATSGVTTTGSTILVGLDRLPAGILLWRALLQWIGGVGIIVMAIVMLPLLRIGGAQLFKIESSDTGDKVEARSLVLMTKIVQVYVLITALCIMTYWLLGMSAFDAVCHAMATISTGGYSTHDASFGYFQDQRLHWAGTLFMLSGAIPFYLYIKAVRGNLRSLVTDSQVRVLVAFSECRASPWRSGLTEKPISDSLTHSRSRPSMSRPSLRPPDLRPRTIRCGVRAQSASS